jgi:hypothetical protein
MYKIILVRTIRTNANEAVNDVILRIFIVLYLESVKYIPVALFVHKDLECPWTNNLDLLSAKYTG